MIDQKDNDTAKEKGETLATRGKAAREVVKEREEQRKRYRPDNDEDEDFGRRCRPLRPRRDDENER